MADEDVLLPDPVSQHQDRDPGSDSDSASQIDNEDLPAAVLALNDPDNDTSCVLHENDMDTAKSKLPLPVPVSVTLNPNSKAAPSPPKCPFPPNRKTASSTSPPTSASTHNSTCPSSSLASTPEPSSPSRTASTVCPSPTKDPPLRVQGLSSLENSLSDSYHPDQGLNTSSSCSPSKDLGYKCPHCSWAGKTQGVLTRHMNVKHK